jgi:hypothetical protein
MSTLPTIFLTNLESVGNNTTSNELSVPPDYAQRFIISVFSSIGAAFCPYSVVCKQWMPSQQCLCLAPLDRSCSSGLFHLCSVHGVYIRTLQYADCIRCSVSYVYHWRNIMAYIIAFSWESIAIFISCCLARVEISLVFNWDFTTVEECTDVDTVWFPEVTISQHESCVMFSVNSCLLMYIAVLMLFLALQQLLCNSCD